jgi:FkbM family methyltransferase
MATVEQFEAFRLEYSRSRSRDATLEDVFFCYRLILARNPDPVGFRAYGKLIEKGISARELASLFIGCPEFVDRKFGTKRDYSIERVTTVHGFDLFVFRTDPVVGAQLSQLGTYEPHVTAAISAYLKPGNAFVDVGANIGYYSCLAAQLVGPTGRVFAVEAYEPNVKLLLANRALGHFDTIEVCPFGAGDRDEIIQLMPIGSIGSSKRLDVDSLTSSVSAPIVMSKRLDGVIPNDLTINALKMDIDGFDYIAFKGFDKFLRRSHPTLFLEIAPNMLRMCAGVSATDYLELIHSYGYAAFTILDGRNPPTVMTDLSKIVAALPDGGSHLDVMIV